MDDPKRMMINRKMRYGYWCRSLALIVSSTLASAAAAATSATQFLDHFYRDVQTFAARFQQVVLDEELNPIEESSGAMQIKRPGRFRWDYEPPNEQVIVGDGSRIWIYDLELEQITVRPMGRALGETPASLLAGGTDVRNEFELQDLGEMGSLVWLRMVPKKSEGGFEDMRIGFEDGQIRVLELVDGLGQTTRITLTEAAENPRLPDSQFQFQPPPGVDVIDEQLE